MRKMTEKEFDDIPAVQGSCPPHEIVKLTYLGTHSDYGCIKCKIKTFTPELLSVEDK